MRRRQGKNLCSLLLTLTMIFGLIPGMNLTAYAAGSKNTDNTCLGTSRIAAPTAPSDKDAAWQGSYVYYGSYEGAPIKFRVLAPSTSVYGGTTMFLDSDATLFNRRFDGGSNNWSTSEIRSYLNGEFLTGSFTSTEIGAIATSEGNGGVTYPTGSYEEYRYGSPVSISDRIFLLDAGEVLNPAYGYSSDCGVTTDSTWEGGNWGFRSVNNRVKGAWWWMRSANRYYSNSAGGVNRDDRYYGGGRPDIQFVDSGGGVAPALNINQSSIIFSTLISGNFNTAGAEYTLTIANDNLEIAVPAGQEVTVTGTTITVPYEISGTDAGTATRASVLILDKAYGTSGAQILYYDALGGTFSNSTATTGTFSLPATLDIADLGTDYYVYILAEDVNGTYETDYASTPVAIYAPAGAVTTADSPSEEPVITPEQAREITIMNFVERLYLVALNRNYDVVGRDYWMSQIKDSGASGSSVARGFFDSQEFIARDLDDEAFVTVLYRVLLDREPDPQGFTNWTNALSNGAARSDVISGFLGSEEWTSLCARYRVNV